MESVVKAIAAPVLFCVGMAACTTNTPVSDLDLRTSGDDPLFLVQTPVTGDRVVMQALYVGAVVEEEGCLRLADEPDSHTVVWPPGFTLVEREAARLVLDERGRTVGQVGGDFRLGGGEVATLHVGLPLERTVREAALHRCPGRYWIVGEVPSQ